MGPPAAVRAPLHIPLERDGSREGSVIPARALCPLASGLALRSSSRHLRGRALVAGPLPMMGGSSTPGGCAALLPVAARPATQSSPSGERGRTRTPRADLAALVPFGAFRVPPVWSLQRVVGSSSRPARFVARPSKACDRPVHPAASSSRSSVCRCGARSSAPPQPIANCRIAGDIDSSSSSRPRFVCTARSRFSSCCFTILSSSNGICPDGALPASPRR